jgi:hypothetical protein
MLEKNSLGICLDLFILIRRNVSSVCLFPINRTRELFSGGISALLLQGLSTKPFHMAPSRAEEKQAEGPVSMRRLMALESLGHDTYRSITPAWAPGNGTIAFGGHVYAQAAYAASKTVSRGMTIHV